MFTPARPSRHRSNTVEYPGNASGAMPFPDTAPLILPCAFRRKAYFTITSVPVFVVPDVTAMLSTSAA